MGVLHQQEELLLVQQNKKNQLLEQEAELKEKIADLDSKVNFIKLGREVFIPEAEQNIEDIEKNTVVSVSKKAIKEQRLQEAQRQLDDLRAQVRQEGALEAAESSLRAAQTDLKRTQSGLKSTTCPSAL